MRFFNYSIEDNISLYKILSLVNVHNYYTPSLET